MTPEQAQQLIQSINQHNWFVLVAIAVAALVNFAIGYFGAYARKKGENLATKEDISALTQTIESIKTNQAARQHYSQVRYERELKVYEDLWPKLCELESIALSLRSGIEIRTSGSNEEQETLKRKQHFMEAHRAFFLAVNHARPFYPPDVWEELNKLIKLCWGEAVQWGLFSNLALMRERENRDGYYEKAEKNADAIKKQIDTICEVIRLRLSKFDSI